MTETQPRRGTVIANYGGDIAIEDDDRNLITCKARKKVGQLVCGDRIEWTPLPDGGAVITAVLPRRSELARQHQRGSLRPVCANIDQIVIVSDALPGQTERGAATPLINLYLLDCYITAAELIAVPPLLVVNKIDCLSDPDLAGIESELAPYGAMGYPVIHTSAKTGDGMEGLRSRLKGHTSVLVGESGVGKSSLISLLLPDQQIRIGEISNATGHGRHTTTTTVLYHLPGGGHIMDSPGVRDFGLWRTTSSELAHAFRDFRPFVDRCRFRNCAHVNDTGCAVVAAVEDGRIARIRWRHYCEILAAFGRD